MAFGLKDSMARVLSGQNLGHGGNFQNYAYQFPANTDKCQGHWFQYYLLTLTANATKKNSFNTEKNENTQRKRLDFLVHSLCIPCMLLLITYFENNKLFKIHQCSVEQYSNPNIIKQGYKANINLFAETPIFKNKKKIPQNVGT